MTELTIKEWAKTYVKYKDMIPRIVESISETENGIVVSQKTGEKITYLCMESIEALNPGSITNERIVCLNTKKNLDWLLKNWDLVKNKRTVFIFVNLDKAESWAINPLLHSAITEKKSLKQGLIALFESVPEASP